MLEFKDISFCYEGESESTLENLSFTLNEREFVSIIGVSGCGKSTIFRIINGLLTPNCGEVLLNGESVLNKKGYCGYMPQRDLLFPWRSIRGNLMLPLEISVGKSRAEMRELAESMLCEVGLSGLGEKYPHELSGGQRQRAAFGRTAMMHTGLLLLDEPFSALDYITRVSMQEWLYGQWQKRGDSVLFITHDVEEAIFLSQRILVIEETPVCSFKEIEIPLPRERTREMLADPRITVLREQLIGILRKQVSA